MSANSDNVLEIERRFAAPPPFVFALWSRPALVSAWWGPEGHRLSACTIDFRPGGHWSFNMEKDGEPYWIRGVYHQITPDRRLTFSYDFDRYGVHSVITVRLRPDADGTIMSFVQTGFPDGDGRDGHGRGWASTFGILERLLLDMHGIGSVYPDLPEARQSSVARDLAAARDRHDAARKEETAR